MTSQLSLLETKISVFPILVRNGFQSFSLLYNFFAVGYFDVTSLFVNVSVAKSLQIIKQELELKSLFEIPVHLLINVIIDLLELSLLNHIFQSNIIL